jgi:hypothetical protein
MALSRTGNILVGNSSRTSRTLWVVLALGDHALGPCRSPTLPCLRGLRPLQTVVCLALAAVSLACITHKCLDISERCRLWQQDIPATPEHPAAVFWKVSKTNCLTNTFEKGCTSDAEASDVQLSSPQRASLCINAWDLRARR